MLLSAAVFCKGVVVEFDHTHWWYFTMQKFDGCHGRCLVSVWSIISRGPIEFWQDTSEKHFSHNRGERSLCGVVLNKLTRPFTAFDTGLAASHNRRHINLQMPSGKLKCQRFSQQHRGPARGIIDWFTFCLKPDIHPAGQKRRQSKRWKSIFYSQCVLTLFSCSF